MNMNKSGKSTYYKVGELVTFIGGEIYVDPFSPHVKYCRPENLCRITSINLKGAHPYALISVLNNQVRGWANLENIERGD